MHADDFRSMANLIESGHRAIEAARDRQHQEGELPGLGAWMIAFAVLVLAQVVLNTKGID